MADPDIDDIKRRMEGAKSVLVDEFKGLRTGRASVSLLDRIVVNAYDTAMPLNQVATVSVPEARLLLVNVWVAFNNASRPTPRLPYGPRSSIVTHC